MTIRVALQETAAITDGVVAYVPEDYYLRFESQNVHSRALWRISVDSLSIMVDSATREFVSLDAYSPANCWQTDDSFVIPTIEGSGALRFDMTFDANGVADVANRPEGKVTYLVNTNSQVVLARLGHTFPLTYFSFSKRLVAGVDSEGVLNEIVMLDVRGIPYGEARERQETG